MVYTPNFLNAVIDNLPLGIIVFDKNAMVMRYNKSLLKYFDLDDLGEPENRTKQFVEALVSNSELNEMLHKAQNGAVIQRLQCEINITKSWNSFNNVSGDRYFQVDIFGTDEDAIQHFVMVLTDLTPIYKDAKAIRESQLNLRTIINNTRYNIFSVDADLRFIEFNNAFKEEFDHLYNGKLQIGDSAVGPPIPPAMIADWIGFYAKAMSGKKIVTDYTFGGNPYLITLNPIIDEGKVTGIAVFSENLTAQTLLLGELEESQFRHRFAMDVSNSGFWDWDLLTNKVYFSNIWKTMLGYNVNEIVNNYESWETLVHEEDLENALSAIKKHISGETETYIVEMRLRTKSGIYKWILAKGRIVEYTADNKPKRFIGVHIDIDHIKSAEVELLKLNGKLREIAFITSHGVRKNLANILGLTSIMDVDKISVPENRDLIEKLILSSNELNEQTIILNEAIRKMNINLDENQVEMVGVINTILVVDDDAVSNLISSRYIEKAGLKSIVYEYPEEALNFLISNADSIDLVLLDINMPNMDGFQFLDEMAKNELNTKVILLTSSINAFDRDRSLNYPAVVDFWNKPMNIEKLKQLNKNSI